LHRLIQLTLRDGSTVRAAVAGQGPPLFLFANMVSWEFWCHQIPILAQRYRVIAPEYRREYLPGATALDALADDVPDMLHALGYERALLMGHSIGAMVLARMLEKTPEVATAVVLANGFLHLRVLPGPLHRLQPRLVPVLRALYPRLPWLTRQLGSYLLLWGDQHIFLHREPAEEKRKMFFGYTFTPDVSMVLRVGAALEYHQPPDLSRATMPVLVVSGGQDRWVSVTQARRLVEHLPLGEHLIWPSVGHMLPMIVPEDFNHAVLEFFGRVENSVL
jgi:pimeloyl-ACP methyl ester carboxylesterase